MSIETDQVFSSPQFNIDGDEDILYLSQHANDWSNFISSSQTESSFNEGAPLVMNDTGSHLVEPKDAENNSDSFDLDLLYLSQVNIDNSPTGLLMGAQELDDDEDIIYLSQYGIEPIGDVHRNHLNNTQIDASEDSLTFEDLMDISDEPINALQQVPDGKFIQMCEQIGDIDTIANRGESSIEEVSVDLFDEDTVEYSSNCIGVDLYDEDTVEYSSNHVKEIMGTIDSACAENSHIDNYSESSETLDYYFTSKSYELSDNTNIKLYASNRDDDDTPEYNDLESSTIEYNYSNEIELIK
eukprot:TRINITY_DN2299_c1_g1_i2.p1 TRINITY_DN2299_c1_g1~~TRINITY_DN2299_c1_g1_i2.p1  ORF type:complete len:298 (-),score=94.09 TRINITY_DN2299_c1_g1_i2:239-1132(-)